jgi:hypothetical protein
MEPKTPAAFTGSGSDAYNGITMTILPEGTQYHSYSELFFAKLATPPTEQRKAIYDSLIRKLYDLGVTTSFLDVCWVFAAADSDTALTPVFVSPSILSRCKAEAKSAPTFTADKGYDGNGTTSYLDTNFNPSVETSSAFAALNQPAIHAWSNTGSIVNGALMGLTNSNTQTYLYSRDSAGKARGKVSIASGVGNEINTTWTSTISQSGWGLHGVVQLNTLGSILRNGKLIFNSSTAGAPVKANNSNIAILRAGTDSATANFGTHRVMAAAISGSPGGSSSLGGAVTEQSLASALRTYLMEVAGITYTQDQQ